MDPTFSSELEALRKRTEDLANRVLAPRTRKVDETGQYPWDIQTVLAQEGYLGVHLPAAYGGGGLGVTGVCVAMEEVARTDASTCGILDACALGSYSFLLGANEEQKAMWLPRLASGRSMASFGLTERGAGSDPAAMESVAVEQPDGSYVVNGSKCFIGNAGPADVYVAYVKLGDVENRQMLAFYVERGHPGFTLGRREQKMGLRGTETFELHFADCVVPPDQILGEPGTGFRLALEVLDLGRVTIGAQALGIARGAFDLALARVQERRQFGRRVIDFQATQFKLADIATDIEATHNLLYALTSAYDRGDPEDLTVRAAALKVFSTEMARRAVNDALQLFGGYGYMKEFPIERMYRDQRVTEIYEGTSEIQRYVLARAIAADGFSRHVIAHPEPVVETP
jgi:alkylation response protein AidB-like acyl-CoA dehydrogenase